MSPPFEPIAALGDYIGGRFVRVTPARTDGHLLSISPRDVTDEVLRAPYRLAAVEDALAAAQRAARGWAERTLDERLKVLGKLKAQLRNHRRELLRLLAREAGLPLWEGEAEVERAIALFDLAAGPARTLVEQESAVSEGLALRPLGVVAILSDFAAPLLDLHRGVLGALAAGNAVVVHPHPLTPALGQLYARIVDEADLPRGVFGLVQGSDDLRIALAGHPGLDGLRLTGSAGMARRITRLIHDQPWKVFRVRTPGKNPMIVLPGADLERAARDATLGAYLTAGQRATSTRWLIAHRKVAAKLLSALDARAGRFRVGDPLDPQTVVGPLASEALRRAFLRHVRGGENEGNRVVRATGILGADPVGWYVGPSLHEVPTVLEGSRYQTHPVLGPDLPLYTVRSADEAFALAASLPTLLCAAVHGGGDKAWQAARRALPALRLVRDGPTTARLAALPLPSSQRDRRTLLEGPYLLREWLQPQAIALDPGHDETPPFPE